MAGRARLNILEALMGTIGGLRTFGLLGVFIGRRARFSATVAMRRQAAPALCAVASHNGNPRRTIEIPMINCAPSATSTRPAARRAR